MPGLFWGPLKLGALGPGPAGPLDMTALPKLVPQLKLNLNLIS